MRPIHLTMSAFGPYSGVEVIDFDELKSRNLFLITGPTGSGKTTVFDAISYALYGKASGDSRTEDTLRSHFSEASLLTEVRLTFALKGTIYHIHRIPKQIRPKTRSEGYTEQKSEAELIIEEREPRTVITGVNKVNKKLEEVIGINEEQFKQIMMIPQGEFRQLLNSDSQEREKVLQQLFDTTIYRRIQGTLNEQAKSLGSMIKSKKIERDTLATKIKCGEDTLLEQMIHSEDKFIDGILIAVSEHMKEDKASAAHLAKSLRKLDQHIEAIVRDQAKALEDNKNLERKDVVTEALQVQEQLSEGMEKQQQQITMAEKAIRLAGIEDNISSREKALSHKKEEKQSIHNRMKALKATLEWSQKAFEKESSTEAEGLRHKRKLELASYKSYVEKVKGLERLMEALQTAEAKHSAVTQNIVSKTEQIQCLKSQMQDQQEEIEALKDVAVALEKARNKHVNETLNLEVYHKLINQLEALSLVEARKIDKVKKEVVTSKAFEAQQEICKKGQYLFLTNQAAFLARELKIGEACPVCGSHEHPMPAKLTEEAISEEDLKTLEEKMAAAETEHRHAKEALVVHEERYSNMLEVYEGLVKDVFDQQAAILIQRPMDEQQEALSKSMQSKKEQLKVLDAEMELLVLQGIRLESQTEALATTRQTADALDGTLKELEQENVGLIEVLTQKKTNLAHFLEEVPEPLRQLTTLMQLIKTSEKAIAQGEKKLSDARKAHDEAKNNHIQVSTAYSELIKTIEEDEATLVMIKEGFYKQLTAVGFKDKEAYLAASISEKQISQMKENQHDFHRNLDRLRVSWSELTEKTKGIQLTDMQQYRLRLEEQHSERDRITDSQGTVKARITDNNATIKRIKTINEQIRDKELKYNVVGKLARIAQGNNPSMMTLERYVLAAFLEDILKAANIRLRQMTQGRYVLSRTGALQRKNKQSGLELEVFDNFTGRSRHVKTLSGGEGFKASLSMALGLSDVVQSYAGGVRLDTMFIDEGFGTLDQESLDSAINCLIDLQKSGRLVGIISHVQELRERIDTRLEIISTNKGSETRFVLG